MLFNSIEFILLLLVIVIVTLVFKKIFLVQKYLLFLASMFFYAYWDWRFLSILVLSIVVNYYVALHVSSNKKWLYIALTFNFFLLFVFKYFNFFLDSLTQTAALFSVKTNIHSLQIILPIGISFYTFQAVSYVVDVYKNETKPILNLIDFGLFLSFFPQIIAGPIERKDDLHPQLQKNYLATKKQILEGFYLFTIGLFQKVLIGDACGKMVDAIYFDMQQYASFEIVCASFLFTFQIYADFAGYSNMARGIGLFFGIELTKNFKQPYFSKNIREFWQKWHITLSVWFRDYLYIPLGGNKSGTNKKLINILLVMTIAGFWHGAGWNFIIWGMYHGVLLLLYHRFTKLNTNKYIGVFTTFILVYIGWIFFRLNNLEQLHLFFNKILHFSFGNFPLRYLKMVLTFGFVLFLIDWLQIKLKTDSVFINFKNQALAFGLAISLFTMCLIYLITNKPNPFIYFQF